jgi:hypothetical protein
MKPKKDNDSKVKWIFSIYFIFLVLCLSFFVLDLLIFVGFIYDFVYKVL